LFPGFNISIRNCLTHLVLKEDFETSEALYPAAAKSTFQRALSGKPEETYALAKSETPQRSSFCIWLHTISSCSALGRCDRCVLLAEVTVTWRSSVLRTWWKKANLQDPYSDQYIATQCHKQQRNLRFHYFILRHISRLTWAISRLASQSSCMTMPRLKASN